MNDEQLDELFEDLGEYRPNQVLWPVMIKNYQPGDATNYQVMVLPDYQKGNDPLVYVAIGAGEYIQAGWPIPIWMIADMFRPVQTFERHPGDFMLGQTTSERVRGVYHPLIEYLRGKADSEMNRWTIFVAVAVAAIVLFGKWDDDWRLPGFINRHNDSEANAIIQRWNLSKGLR